MEAFFEKTKAQLVKINGYKYFSRYSIFFWENNGMP